MAKRGPKSKYDATFHPKLIKYLARLGNTDEEIAKELNISVATFNNWKKSHPEILEPLKENKSFIDSLVEDSLLKRALGYSYIETHEEQIVIKDPNDKEKIVNGVKRKVIKKNVAPDVTAQIFWLKNRQKERWRDRIEVDPKGDSEKDLSFDLEAWKEIVKEKLLKKAKEISNDA